MPRLKQVRRENASPLAKKMYDQLFGDRDPVDEPGTATGTPGNWWTVFALVPDVLEHAVRGFGLYRSPDRKLDPRLRELGMTRAGFTRGSQFVFSQHCKSCRSVGLSEEKIEAVPSWQTADCYEPLERAVLAYTDCLVQDSGRVPDATFAALKKSLSDEEILELTYVTCTYDLHATMCRALRLEFDDVDERIVEIPAPDERANFDIMADISQPKE
ncbi:MAG: alkylhydroperoxidase family enzyme [Myxococcota bacterium]|jgi:alkylhydroperoxidase family enzyme